MILTINNKILFIYFVFFILRNSVCNEIFVEKTYRCLKYTLRVNDKFIN